MLRLYPTVLQIRIAPLPNHKPMYQEIHSSLESCVYLTDIVGGYKSISPNTTPLKRVQSKLLNCKTGTAYTLPEFSVLASEENTNPLSPREKEILKMVKNGLLRKEISEQLTISVHTVNTHRQRILEKLNVANSIEAIQYASRLGLLD